jgi:hypothetical protein
MILRGNDILRVTWLSPWSYQIADIYFNMIFSFLRCAFRTKFFNFQKVKLITLGDEIRNARDKAANLVPNRMLLFAVYTLFTMSNPRWEGRRRTPWRSPLRESQPYIIFYALTSSSRHTRLQRTNQILTEPLIRIKTEPEKT